MNSEIEQPDIQKEPSHTQQFQLDDATLTVATWGTGPAEIVLLHDGLGSIDQWRSIPTTLAATTGRTVVAYDRPGHGGSTPVPTGPWPADWLHREAERFSRLMTELDFDNPLLVGHSDGGSIALLYAAALGAGHYPGQSIRGLLTMAAHSWVEQTCFDAIVGMRENTPAIVKGLARNNVNPDALFEAWSGVWVSADFREWNVLSQLSTIAVPTLVAQGHNDEYAESAHAVDTATAIGDNAEWRLLDDVGHLLHHQDPELVVDVIAAFDRAVGS